MKCGPTRLCPECRERGALTVCACGACAAAPTAALATVSVETIAAETSSSVRSVRRAIRELAALGVLSCTGPDEFAIHLDVLGAMPKVADGA